MSTASNPVRPPQFFDVPPSSRWKPCKGCGARIYWVLSQKSGRPLPIHCDVPDGKRPRVIDDADGRQLIFGRGINHFTDCPDRDRFRKVRT